MFDYISLQGSSENPTFVTILFTVLLSFVLSSLIAFTYDRTDRHVRITFDFLQTLVLVAIIAATVMQAIGDSLARGLGMLGALAIIRFRTTLRTPRNMVFVFASLAAGISCGVYGYVIGITGTIGFCLAAFILNFSPIGRFPPLLGLLKFDLPIDLSLQELIKVETLLKQYCASFKQMKHQISKTKIKSDLKIPDSKIIAYEYQIRLKKSDDTQSLDYELSKLAHIDNVKLGFSYNQENL